MVNVNCQLSREEFKLNSALRLFPLLFHTITLFHSFCFASNSSLTRPSLFSHSLLSFDFGVFSIVLVDGSLINGRAIFYIVFLGFFSCISNRLCFFSTIWCRSLQMVVFYSLFLNLSLSYFTSYFHLPQVSGILFFAEEEKTWTSSQQNLLCVWELVDVERAFDRFRLVSITDKVDASVSSLSSPPALVYFLSSNLILFLIQLFFWTIRAFLMKMIFTEMTLSTISLLCSHFFILFPPPRQSRITL